MSLDHFIKLLVQRIPAMSTAPNESNRCRKKESHEFEIAPGVTVAMYREWERAPTPDRECIANMVKRRFESRFIDPVLRDGRVQGGFAAVALCCLAIQALDTLRHRRGPTASALERFIRDNAEFADLRDNEHDFYEHVRNALHHQAETTGGWRIHITGPLFASEEKIVGAQALVDGVRTALNRYCDELRRCPIDSRLWRNLTVRMNEIIGACDDEAGA